ncbi:sensor histidine kinase [Undibacterium sp. Rencai35W]|uniref:sensor histidine kinase n=1 Tax=Undibacterium sp. Rencai35W TaxID=3413046 RepID=UPI003BF34ED0
MFTSLVFILRKTFGGMVILSVFIVLVVNVVFRYNPPDWFFLVPVVLSALIAAVAFSHVRRVRLISIEVTASTLANRQRRQIEIPLETSLAFALVEAAIRELPGVERVESAHDSLQVRAKIKRINPYQDHFFSQIKCLSWLVTKRNQILATVTPGDDVGSISVLCEPEKAVWTDLFLVDNGTNLENMQAIGRAISRRIAEQRHQEKVSAQQTVIEKELTVAKLNLLHAQVEPHFLYNTLASAQILTRTDPAGADQMLGNLITYLRYSLPRTEDSLSTLGEELERTKAYLDIMKIRMGSRLQLQIEVGDNLRKVLFPSMMLQTLVENAIKHGLEPQSGGGTIWILARFNEHHEQSVSVTVADDGHGFSAEGAGTGIGLHNVRERLRLAYGATASFAIVANFPSGVTATINVPANFLQGASHA